MLYLTPCSQISSKGGVNDEKSRHYDLGDLEVAGEGVLMAGRAAGWPLGMPGACRPPAGVPLLGSSNVGPSCELLIENWFPNGPPSGGAELESS